ncbi:MAG: DNA polymerase III subunit beta [Deltaproteobacteria bacterium]|nr:DNA polymerase III subunit beta [Deltaproteobacteria bacterium]
MKVQIDRDVLLQGVSRTQGIVDRRGTLPILGNLLFGAEKDQVNISATDLEVSFRGSYPAQVQEEGQLTVPAISFFNIIRELPSAPLDIQDTDNANLIIQLGEARYQLMGLPADQFPPLPTAETQQLVAFETQMLKEMFDRTSFSVSGDDMQYHLAGVYVEKITENDIIKLRLVSTDGHRLSLIDRVFAGAEQFGFAEGVIIPRKGIAEMQRLLADGEQGFLGLDRKTLILRQDNKFLFVRLLDKKFPDYRRIIPSEFRLRIVLPRRELFEALKRLSQLSSDRFKGVILKFNQDMLEIQYVNPEVGEGRERLPLWVPKSGAAVSEAETADQEAEFPIEIGFNARYLLEPLGVMASDRVIVEINDKDKPCRLQGENDPDYFCIIMPMSL